MPPGAALWSSEVVSEQPRAELAADGATVVVIEQSAAPTQGIPDPGVSGPRHQSPAGIRRMIVITIIHVAR